MTCDIDIADANPAYLLPHRSSAQFLCKNSSEDTIYMDNSEEKKKERGSRQYV